MSNSLQVDEARAVLGRSTGIFVRAMREGKWGSYDIWMLDRPSLMTWLRSRGGQNEWAESVVAALLEHDQ